MSQKKVSTKDLYSNEERKKINEDYSKPKKIICPYCKGEATEYYSIWAKIICPIALLDSKINKFRCKKCKRFFNEKQRRHPEAVEINVKKEKSIKLLKLILFIIFIIWLIYNFIF